jgi:hypothetical protein
MHNQGVELSGAGLQTLVLKCHFTGKKTSKVMALTGRSETWKSGSRRASLAADYACSPLMSSFLVSRERGNVGREGERERWEGNAKSKRSLSAGGRVMGSRLKNGSSGLVPGGVVALAAFGRQQQQRVVVSRLGTRKHQKSHPGCQPDPRTHPATQRFFTVKANVTAPIRSSGQTLYNFD